MIGTCATCRNWEPIDLELWDTMINPERPIGWGQCQLTESKNLEPLRPTLAFASEFDPYHAILVTAPDFGCTQYAAKELV